MSVPSLLSSTAITTSPDFRIKELRAAAFDYVDKHQPSDALEFLNYLFFSTSFAGASLTRKQYLLRVTWRHIADFYVEHFKLATEETLDWQIDAVHREWAEEIENFGDDIKDQLKPEIMWEFELAVGVGKATVLITQMCNGEIPFAEITLKTAIAYIK